MYGPKMFDLFYLFDLRRELVPNPRHEMAAGASHPRQRYIRDSGWCYCDVTEMTLKRATLARSYWKCRALWVIHKKTLRSERNACV